MYHKLCPILYHGRVRKHHTFRKYVQKKVFPGTGYFNFSQCFKTENGKKETYDIEIIAYIFVKMKSFLNSSTKLAVSTKKLTFLVNVKSFR